MNGSQPRSAPELYRLPPDRTDRIVVIGAGALARDIVSMCAQGTFSGVFVEPGFDVRSSFGLPLLRDWGELGAQATHYVVGVLEAAPRRRLRDAAEAAGLHPAPAMVAPSAFVSDEATLAAGSLMGNNVQVGACTRIGRDVLVMHNGVVGHDVEVGAGTVVLPGAWIGGYSRIGADCFIGANSVVSPGLQVGDGCTIAPGAACLKDLAAGRLLIGNPGRVVPQRRPGS